MTLPRSHLARVFYRAAYQRFGDAEFLMNEGRTTGAVYLAGYGVECMLKALILESLATEAQKAMVASFRGRRAHDFEWLKERYTAGGGGVPAAVARHLARVNTWSIDMRYEQELSRPARRGRFWTRPLK
jgi:hypothetical protein